MKDSDKPENGAPAPPRRAAEIQSHELRLLRSIAGDAPLQEVLDDLCLTLQSLASRPLRCAVMITDAPRTSLVCLAAPSLPETFRKKAAYAIRDGASTCAQALRSGLPVIVADALADGSGDDVLALRRGDGYRAIWSHPVLQDGGPLGTLAFLPDAPGTPAAQDERLIEFGVQVARLALAHERSRQALQASEKRFRDFADMAADWYWEQDADFRFTEVTYGPGSRPAAPPYYDQGSVGKQRWELPYVNLPEGFWDEHRRLLAAGRPFTNLHLQRREADGGLRHVEISGRPVFDAAGRLAGYRGVGRDITARIAAENKTAELGEWLKLAVDAAHIGLWERDPDTWTFRFTSDWQDRFGYPDDDIEDSSARFDRLVHPDDLERIHAGARAYIANPAGEYENEFRLRHRDGAWHWVLSRGTLVADAATGRRRWMGCHIDITQQKSLLEALGREEKNYRQLLSNNPLPVWIFDTGSLQFLEVSEGACALTGHSREDLLATKVVDMRPPEEREAFREYLGRVVPLGHCDLGLWQTLRKDGSRILTRVTWGGVDYAGRPAIIAFLQDVTEQARAEAQVRELNATLEDRVKARTAELEAANQELDAFNYSVSHDLRAPLRSVDGFSQALIEDYAHTLDDAGRDYLGRIRAAAQRMGELIDAMYHLSKLSRSLLQIRELDLSATAQVVIEELRLSDPARRVNVVIEPGIRTEGDADLMRVVLTNLLDNAWKYTARTEHARIEFGVIRGGENNPIYFVRDNGAGFDMQFSDKLFKLFQRLHREEDFSGHGVGLATVQRIVRRHGGRIRAEGEKGRGATFYFTLWEDAAMRRETESALLGKLA